MNSIALIMPNFYNQYLIKTLSIQSRVAVRWSVVMAYPDKCLLAVSKFKEMLNILLNNLDVPLL